MIGSTALISNSAIVVFLAVMMENTLDNSTFGVSLHLTASPILSDCHSWPKSN